MSDNKIPPYKVLRSILDENELTENASRNLDSILGIEKKVKKTNFFVRIFQKIDSWIFSKPDKMWNTVYHKRKK